MNGIARNHNITLIEVGGTGNHVHVLMALPSDVPIAKAIQVLKANSSRWVREHGVDFSWQEGYGAFSVSASNRAAVRSYIQNQEDHHRKWSFEDEFVLLLKKCGVPYDPKFVLG
jgi:REP element-mobilizing transposase RayT